ncbi:uncharacterized protein LOC116667319 isoform X5 [Camelus ferus]|uniref:Uncharacterized protein LOC116661708 isoform X2 n=1 Tax=Camelus ferus TaxID=419612 RepID=A0A8B8SIP4_CAMFR|nr:uncharacterized protein LOC116661708 isoform X2 [Camelus ferus]XP_032347900.1 uncharacterized protein LOC116667319 isoform X5 [Camelus ferus]XP_032347901.1 uncharacterized protein LOC116667319 isoform X5 [Camelus ferus]
MSVTSLSLPHLLLQIEQDPGGSTKPVPSAILCVMSCDPVDAQHPPAEETDCLRYMKGEDTYYPHGAQVGLGVCCLYSRWARVALGIPVPEFLQYTRCLFPNLQNWNDVNHPAVHSMVHPRLELSGSKSISEGTYLKRNGFPDSEGQRKHQPGLEKENSISEPVLGDLTEITLVAQASDREHVPSCSQPQTSTDASYTGKDPGLGGRWPPEIRQMLDSRAASAAVEAGRRSPGELGPGRRRRRRRLGVGVRSRELLHFFSPPRPGLGATSAARDLPEVRLQKPDARLQVSLLLGGGRDAVEGQRQLRRPAAPPNGATSSPLP